MAVRKKIVIIAEAGVNHNGDLELAKQMADQAKWAGADYVKFQTFIPQKLVTRNAQKADYQKRETENSGLQLEMLERLALTQDAFRILHAYCKEIGIGFLSTPFDFESIDFLGSLDMDYWKLPSGEITDLPFLERVAGTGKKILLSTGMSRIDEIRSAVDILERGGAQKIILLHCNTQYPTPFADVNLLAMGQMRDVFCKEVGYSDHTLGIEVPVAAAALGACVIEKHFTLDRGMAGPDHRASLEPDAFAEMVREVRNIEAALGDGKKKVTASERHNITAVRKSIVASRDIKAGEIFTEENVTVKRPGHGISPMEWYRVLGNAAARDYAPDELLDRGCIDA